MAMKISTDVNCILVCSYVIIVNSVKALWCFLSKPPSQFAADPIFLSTAE